MWRLNPVNLLAAAWAWLALRQIRRQLSHGVMAPVVSVAPPPHTGSARRAVDGVLERTSATCLEGALVRQLWLAREGRRFDVVIGVPPDGFATTSAHAWLDGYETEPVSDVAYVEIHRLPPPG